jgi:hypothetical protein
VTAQAKLVDAIEFPDAPPTETVAVIDSLAPEDSGNIRTELGVVKSYIETNLEDTSGHGSIVSNRIQNWGCFERYDFYQIIDENGLYRDGDLAAAIEDAHHNGADIINVSAACDHMSMGWKSCSPQSQPCSVCQTVNDVVASGTTVVAAAGNSFQLDVMGCPGLTDAAICVGAAVAKCTAEPTPAQTTTTQSSSEWRPPGAYYLMDGHESSLKGTYCSMEGCSPGESCSENKLVEYSEANVAEVNGKPDVLAPSHVLVLRDGEPAISRGTSWAAPFVTGQLGSIVSGLLDVGVNVVDKNRRTGGATNLHRMLESQGRKVDDCESRLYDGNRIITNIEANTPLSFERRDPSVNVVRDDRY